MTDQSDSGQSTRRLVKITLDEGSIGRSSADIEHERAVAIYDLIEDNSFAPSDHDGGPYALQLSIAENRLAFDVRLDAGLVEQREAARRAGCEDELGTADHEVPGIVAAPARRCCRT